MNNLTAPKKSGTLSIKPKTPTLEEILGPKMYEKLQALAVEEKKPLPQLLKILAQEGLNARHAKIWRAKKNLERQAINAARKKATLEQAQELRTQGPPQTPAFQKENT